MRDSGALWPVAAVFIAAVAFMPSARTPSATPASSPATPGPAEARAGLGQQPSDPRSCNSEEVLDYAQKHPFRREFLIATLPDPLDSQTGWLFDGQLEAVLAAIEHQGKGYANHYMRDRYALPWLCARAAKDLAERDPLARQRLERLHERQPGVVLFRDLTNQKLLVLFVVGETATDGVHSEALRRAVDEVAKGREACVPRDCLVRLMAPTYSGSVASLRIELGRWWRQLPASKQQGMRFRLVSGTASNPKNKSLLEATVLEVSQGGDQLPGPPIEFQATVAPEDALLKALYDYLQKLGAGPQDVALLAESSTAYGAAVQASGGDREWLSPLLLPFPQHIGRLRSANERAGLFNSPPQAVTAPRAVLELSVDDTEASRETMPAFAPKALSVSDDLILGQLLSTLSRERRHYVGFYATDAHDKLFLAKKIHQYWPDAVFFTTRSDLLYIHPDMGRDLEGMIVASSYPLFNANQSWSPPWWGDRERRQFPRDAAEGAYNATLALLGRSDLLEYGEPFAVESGDKPPVWLSVVGRQALWPLTVVQPKDERGYQLRTPPLHRGAARPTLPLRRHFIAACMLAVFVSTAALRMLRRGGRAARERGELGQWRLWGGVMCLGLTGLIMLPLLAVLLVPASFSLGMSVPSKWVFWYLRASDLGSGVSAILPLLFLGAGASLLGWAQIRRLWLAHEQGGVPYGGCLRAAFGSSLNHSLAVQATEDLEAHIHGVIARGPSKRAWLALVILGLSLGYGLGLHPGLTPVFDAPLFYDVFALSLWLVLVGVLYAFAQFTSLWGALAGLLSHFSLHPLVWAFNRMPRRLNDIFRWRPLPEPSHIEPLLEEHLQLLVNHYARVRPELQSEGLLGAPACAYARWEVTASMSRGTSLRLLTGAIGGIVEAYWCKRPLSFDLPPEDAARHREIFPQTLFLYAPGMSKDVHLWIRLAEDFMAMNVVRLIHYGFLHLWNLLTLGMLALIAVMFAVTAYPFQPERLLGAGLMAIAGGLVLWTLAILLKINRNDLLSRIEKTEPNKTTFDPRLFSQISLYGVLPILSLIAAQFPGMGFLFSWLDGLLKVFK